MRNMQGLGSGKHKEAGQSMVKNSFLSRRKCSGSSHADGNPPNASRTIDLMPEGNLECPQKQGKIKLPPTMQKPAQEWLKRTARKPSAIASLLASSSGSAPAVVLPMHCSKHYLQNFISRQRGSSIFVPWHRVYHISDTFLVGQ